MKKLFKILLVTILTFSIVGCTQNDNSGNETTSNSTITITSEDTGYKKLDVSDAKEMIDNNPDVIILDVRTDEEYLEKRIPDSVLLPDFEIAEKAEAELPNKDATILVYCRSGNRSKSAVMELIEMGYTNVYDFGGIIDWPYETISD